MRAAKARAPGNSAEGNRMNGILMTISPFAPPQG